MHRPFQQQHQGSMCMPTQTFVSVVYHRHQVTPSISFGTQYWLQNTTKISVSEVLVNRGIGLSHINMMKWQRNKTAES